AAAKNLAICLDIAGEWDVFVDPARGMQIFWNLLNNAIKYTPPGGRIEVTATPAGPEILAMEVRDTGIGLEHELLGRIFDAFEQGTVDGREAGSGQRGGLGLGLAIVR